VYFYSGDAGETDWKIYLFPSYIDEWTTTHDETYLTITRTLDTSLVAGDEVEVMTYTNVGLYAGPVMIIFEIER